MNMRKITSVAVKLVNDRIFEVPIGKSHHHALVAAEDAGAIASANSSSDGMVVSLGFMDNEGNFLNRTEAMEVAKAANQVVMPVGLRKWLDSYDLWISSVPRYEDAKKKGLL